MNRKVNRIALVLCLGCFLFSCRSKKAVITKRPNTTTVEKGGIDKEETKKPSGNSTKVYANATERYIDDYKEIAQQEMRLYGIPASITLAQGVLESGSGKGRLSVKANNHFGIKCHGWTGGKIYHDDDKAQECFRKYKDAKYSFRDHSLFLQKKRYAKLFKLKKENYRGWAKELRAAGYATDKKYPQKLIGIIERYELYKLDKEVLGNSYEEFEAPIIAERITYTVSKGDTLYAISRKYNMTVEELQKLNGLTSTALNIGQVLVVKP
ncbi:glucosaminidase domain-containing protein [Flavivirga sp. 57AJ16]|uniref:glucosaminidase domain-containing protein n=1 Tax=Flavivirga sp. 57AJ16 TaxID=3025307 RepID=UPI00236637E8|nr:glucosaminidase domain-containing protein [Flavivirga sp. 57AJ16]MDD7888179.1 glucosaminidase domain-containing protein [Flavivirga sp. 57AJ16]